MGQKFCTGCGAVLPEGIRFCEVCGAAVDQAPDSIPRTGERVAPSVPRESSGSPVHSLASMPPDKKPSRKIIAAIAIVAGIAVIAAVLFLVVMPALSQGNPAIVPVAKPNPLPASPSLTPGVVITISNPASTASPISTGTPVPDPFPNALNVKDMFPFSSGSTAGFATVYRVWMNDTYFWHNDKDNKYYIQTPKPGNKYLFVFASVYNAGSTRFWPPTSSSVTVHYSGRVFYTDPEHYLPDISSDPMDTPVEVREVQYFSKLYGSEYVEDFGYSHGGELGFLYPGKSNAMDGYLIYEVPASLTLDKAYAVIEFNGKDTGVWKLG
jgi:hypothetical protein